MCPCIHGGLTSARPAGHRTPALQRIDGSRLIYPDGKATDEELLEVVTLACELRQRVHDQLCKLAPGEFTAEIDPAR